MNKRCKSEFRIPSFKAIPSFKPAERESGAELLDQANDPLLLPEEQGRINRYLRYADTLIKSQETNGSESTGAETTDSKTGSDEIRLTDNKKAA